MKYCLILANDFEEIEALAQVDILRRANITVDTYGVGSNIIKGSHNIKVYSDFIFNNVNDIKISDYDGLLLPGGVGTMELVKNDNIIKLIQEFYNSNKLIFAICAAPLLLDKAGILKGKKFTCYPATAKDIKNGERLEEKVVVDGNIITSQGLGTSIDAALKLIEIIISKNEAENMAKKIVYKCS